MSEVTWRSPSNIALVKYWGKHANQIPANPSISLTLSTSHTTTTLHWLSARVGTGTVSVLLDGIPRPDFLPKIKAFYARVAPYVPFVADYDLIVDTGNSFPHGSGIASSASGLSALALCTLSMAEAIGKPVAGDFFQQASILARLGSGSASRSVYGPLALWGNHQHTPNSSNEYAIPYTDINPIFEDFQDYILLVDKGEKAVSSTAGHNLMNGHPFAEARFAQAHQNLTKLQNHLRTGDLEAFGQLVESEALTLHAMMMTGNPYYMLFRANTIAIIQKLWQYRAQTKLPIYFTLDAGANVHLLFPKNIKQTVDEWVKEELSAYCQEGSYLCDHVGKGPIQM